MAQVVCKKCEAVFDTKKHRVMWKTAMLAGAVAGGVMGSGIGIAGGPLGAIAGTVPGAVIGGALAGLGVSKFAQCPECEKIQAI